VITFNLPAKSIDGNRQYWLAFFLLATPVVIQLFSVLLFVLNISISRFHFPVALLITYLLVLYLRRHELKTSADIIKFFTKTSILFVISLVFACQFIDFSFDGQSYHIPAMIALASGWNPLLSSHLIDWNPLFAQESGTELFIDHYPLGSWILAATVYKATGLIESGKVFNMIYMFALYLLAIDFLKRLCDCSSFKRYLLAGLISLNPVIICQMNSFYIDGQIAALISMAIILSIDFLCFKEHRAAILLSLVIISLVNVKMTGLVYASIIGASIFLGLLMLGRQPWRFTGIFLTAWLIAVLIVGFHPYVSNTLQHKTPFYPIGVDIKNPLENQEASLFLEKNRLEKLLYSLAGRKNSRLSMPELKSPLYISKSDIWEFEGQDISFGAFGPLFLLVTLELLIVSAFVLMKERKINFFFLCGLALLLITMAPISELWKARYAPQLWLLPIALLIVLYNNKQACIRGTAQLGGLLLIINVSVISYVNLSKSHSKSQDFSESMAILKKLNQDEENLTIYIPLRKTTYKTRLLDHAISFKMVDTPTCSNPINIGFPTELSMKVCKQKT